jgi:hypothetical protein
MATTMATTMSTLMESMAAAAATGKLKPGDVDMRDVNIRGVNGVACNIDLKSR